MGSGISYDPGIAYHGDAYMFNALSGAGRDIHEAMAESMAERRKQEQLAGYNDAIVNHAAQTGLITPDELNKYNSASLSQKTSIAAGYAANIHDDLQRQLTGQKIAAAKQALDQGNQLFPVQLQGAKTEADTAEAGAKLAGSGVFTADGKTQVGVYDAKGTPHYFRGMGPDAADEPTKIDVVTDPSTNQKVGVVRKTGAPLRTQSDDIPNLQLDPTGQFYWDGHNHTWRQRTMPKAPDPVQAAIAAQIGGAPAGSAPAVAAPAAATGAVKITSKAQFDALASGTLFQAPDGSVRRKP